MPMNCFNCGAEVPEGQNFCGNCGAPQIADPGVEPEAPASARKPASGSMTWLWALLGCTGFILIACCLGTGLLFTFSSVVSDSAGELLEQMATIEPELFDEALGQISTQLPETTPAPSIISAATETSQPTATPQFQCAGLGLTTEPWLTVEVTCEQVPAQNENEFLGLPAHTELQILGYPVTPSFHLPRVMVFPVEEYRLISPEASDRVDQLQELLRRKPDPAEEPYPFLPVWNAGQMMAAQFNYVEFVDGEGIRYLTQYGQAAWPINNKDLFYTFQGLTSDGEYYLSALFPVTHPDLPPDGDAYIGEAYDEFIDGYAGYLDEIEAQLEASASKAFEPGLNALDAVVSTLDLE